MNKLKPSLAALILSAALAAGPAAAAINWNDGGFPTTFQDNDLDVILTSDLTPKAGGILAEGDVLLSVFEVDDAGGVALAPAEELTGILGIQIDSIGPVDAFGRADIVFQPYTGGLNALLALGTRGETVPGGGPGGGAMVAMYLDPSPDLNIDAAHLPIPPGNFDGCDTLAQCIDSATDGGDYLYDETKQWQVDGFIGDPDEIWLAGNAFLDTSVVLATSPAFEVAAVNGAGSLIYNGTGRQILDISCLPFCGPGGDGLVDVVVGGSVKGGLGLPAGLIAEGVFGTSDFDFQKIGVPEPSTLALLAAGFLGVGAAQRRRRKAGGV